jgi:hypothetical protein
LFHLDLGLLDFGFLHLILTLLLNTLLPLISLQLLSHSVLDLFLELIAALLLFSLLLFLFLVGLLLLMSILLALFGFQLGLGLFFALSDGFLFFLGLFFVVFHFFFLFFLGCDFVFELLFLLLECFILLSQLLVSNLFSSLEFLFVDFLHLFLFPISPIVVSSLNKLLHILLIFLHFFELLFPIGFLIISLFLSFFDE